MQRTVQWLLLSGLLLWLPCAQARDQSAQVLGEVIVAELPTEARATLRLIKRGGPFPFARDGVVFGNRERHLPNQPRDYYHEYTVPTPGVQHRGARRIVCGAVAECYYTADHYRTFRRIRE